MNKKGLKDEIIIKDIREDFSEEIKDKKRIIILVEHSKSYAKTYVFAKYINKRFKNKGRKYVIALAQEEFIDVNRLDSKCVISVLKEDMNKNYKDFKERYPEALMEKVYSFNYALDYSEKTNKAEIMSITLIRLSNEYSRVQYSPIIPISKEVYLRLIGKDKNTEEAKLLHDIITEKVMGIELYGLIGYLTEGKYKTANIYMENLLDIIPDFKMLEESRAKTLRYKKFRATKSAYMKSLKPVE